MDKTGSREVPGGDHLQLMQRGQEFSIMAGTTGLMNSRLSCSEEALATLSAARLKDRPKARVLIGVLGMGFTLRATLDCLGPESARHGKRGGARPTIWFATKTDRA